MNSTRSFFTCRNRHWHAWLTLALSGLGLLPGAAFAATVPSGFTDSIYAEVPTSVTSMAFAPDGRLFVTEQGGRLRVIQNRTLLATPFLTVPVEATGERGLLGVAFDPDFERNHFVYIYYTARTPTVHNRVSRFTANGNVAVPGSERVLLDLSDLSSAAYHNGGALHFGVGGRLYIAVGDNGNGGNAQSLASIFGKVLRINPDGSIPADNPFINTATGINRSIFAYGLRNPFTTAVQPSTGRLFINDVGQATYEEINPGRPGANYGWPQAEGFSTNPAFTNPVHVYGHGEGACAITGGVFYEPDVPAFPSLNYGQYFFADHCGGWIRRFNPLTGASTGFATAINGPLDLDVGPDGALYYLARRGGIVGKISYATAQAPVIELQPASHIVAVGQSVTFKVGATGSAPLTFQWRRNGSPISGANASSYTRNNVQLNDNGSFFDVVVSNSLGRDVSDTAQLSVLLNAVPTASINQPVGGTTYAAGNVINYAGTGNDAEDGTLPPSAFTWWVDLHHDSHIHPAMQPRTGSRTGSFTIPVSGETSPNVFYRINLQVRDSVGLTRTVSRDVLPRKTTIRLTTNPAGLQLRLDGQPVSSPYTFVGVEGLRRTIEALSPQSASGATWVFSSWSDGGAQFHTIRTPVADTTYTAQFKMR